MTFPFGDTKKKNTLTTHSTKNKGNNLMLQEKQVYTHLRTT